MLGPPQKSHPPPLSLLLFISAPASILSHRCFVCDVKASECRVWWCVGQAGESHCNASDTAYWRAKKQAHSNAAAAAAAARVVQGGAGGGGALEVLSAEDVRILRLWWGCTS
jgi:hypothetical protein